MARYWLSPFLHEANSRSSWPNLVNKGFITWSQIELFLAEPTREISSDLGWPVRMLSWWKDSVMQAALTTFACSRVVLEHQLKRLGDFLFSAIAYLSSALFIYFVFLLGFSFINDKSFTFFRQIRTCALRIPIPAPARNPFSLLSLPLQANSS